MQSAGNWVRSVPKTFVPIGATFFGGHQAAAAMVVNEVITVEAFFDPPVPVAVTVLSETVHPVLFGMADTLTFTVTCCFPASSTGALAELATAVPLQLAETMPGAKLVAFV